MFFPEHLLSKSGPLARVWLAANLEKKLSKTQVLTTKIDDDIGVIIRPEVAGGPIALRLSGQLLLGVVRIYSRKARYLLDDCNEALMKIKMAFRPGNVDLPTNSHIANPATLTLPDVLTEIDLLAPMPDPALLLSQTLPDLTNLGLMDVTVPDWDDSQFLPSTSVEQARGENVELELDEDDLGLDLTGEGQMDVDPSIEIGRDEPLERRASEEFGGSEKILDDDDDLGLALDGELDDTAMAPMGDINIDDPMDIDMGGMTDFGADLRAQVEEPAVEQEGLERAARDDSPLSSIRSSVERDLEQTFQLEPNQTMLEAEEQEDESVHQPQRVKRRRVLHADASTEISSTQIREQQNDRSNIIKEPHFLPRDPLLLALQSMQKSGGFVSSILGDGRSRGWAPELRGILSLEVVQRSGQKRKRDSGVADLEEGDHVVTVAEKTPQLEFEDDSGLAGVEPDLGGDTGLGQDDEIIQLPDEPQPLELEEEDDAFSPVPENFDDTTAPLLHPADSGPVSQVTKQAVYFLRDQFGVEAESSEEVRQNSSVLFQDMFPEASTTKKDATNMFFEILILATKDAIKVDQPTNQLGGPIKIRGKRGLWGEWAETSASGELAAQEQPPPSPSAVAAA